MMLEQLNDWKKKKLAFPPPWIIMALGRMWVEGWGELMDTFSMNMRRKWQPVPQAARVCALPRDWGKTKLSPALWHCIFPPSPMVPGSWAEPLRLYTLKLPLVLPPLYPISAPKKKKNPFPQLQKSMKSDVAKNEKWQYFKKEPPVKWPVRI